jgi:chemotaxis signal transduction protein
VSAAPEPASDRALCLLFRSAGERYAVQAKDVLKVIGHSRLCRLPRLPKAILGITHHRGRIVTVFDASVLLLRGPVRPKTDLARVLVIDRGARNLGLLVDAVDEIQTLKLGGRQVEGIPSLHVVQHDGQAVHGVDTDRLLEALLATARE